MSPRQTAGTLSACHRAPSVPRATCQLRDRGSREEESKFVPWQRWGWVCVLQPALSSSLSFLSPLFCCRSYKDGEITATVLGKFKLKTCRGIKHRGDFVSIGSVRNCWGGGLKAVGIFQHIKRLFFQQRLYSTEERDHSQIKCSLTLRGRAHPPTKEGDPHPQ